MNEKYWNHHWRNLALDAKQVLRKQNLQRFTVIKKHCEKKFGNGRIKFAEIGSGLGVNSLLLSLAFPNSEYTLIDFSQPALEKAKLLHKTWGRSPRLVFRNLLEIDAAETYDLIMSYGMAEHFTGTNRVKIVKAHFDLCRPGGVVFISVPNRYCPVYTLDMFLINKLRKIGLYQYFSKSRAYEHDIEIPFSRKELESIMDGLGIPKYQIYGISFAQAIDDFLRFTRYPMEKFHLGRLSRILHFPRLRLPLLDHYCGQILLAVAEKPSEI